jgi:hypothetical protein
VIQVEEVSPEKPSQKEYQSESYEDQNARLLSEMKRNKLLYLRKTPDDIIIENLMLEKRISRDEAHAIYMKQCEKNLEKERSRAGSPNPGRDSARGIMGIKDSVAGFIEDFIQQDYDEDAPANTTAAKQNPSRPAFNPHSLATPYNPNQSSALPQQVSPYKQSLN